MVSHFQEQESLLQNPIFDALYCEEELFDENVDSGFGLKEPKIEHFNEIQTKPFAFLFEHDLVWEGDELASLLSKEKAQARLTDDKINSDGSLKMARNEAIRWMLKVIGYYGFNVMTALLAVNYYDGFIASIICFQKDKPWMSQLTAVACLSIAAKVEETRVPLLLDLQVEESEYMFEAKTIQRMELLVLSALEWKMNPVTPISFVDHIVRRFDLMTNLHWDFLKKCESIILSIITDCRLVHYLPSVIAAATMIHVIREMQACDALEYQTQVMTLLGISKEKIDDCHKLIVEAMYDFKRKPCHKRKQEYMASSPSGVIDTYFSSDSSVDSWAAASSVSSLPESVFKRSRTQDQHMRLSPPGSVSVSLASHPR